MKSCGYRQNAVGFALAAAETFRALIYSENGTTLPPHHIYFSKFN